MMKKASASAGYSGKSAVQKLGIPENAPLVVLGTPVAYEDLVGSLPAGTKVMPRIVAGATFIHLFSQSRTHLERTFPQVARALADDGMLWVSWPKKSSAVASDLTESIIREIGLRTALVDVKVCAVDETWSGLKFVRRLRARG